MGIDPLVTQRLMIVGLLGAGFLIALTISLGLAIVLSLVFVLGVVVRQRTRPRWPMTIEFLITTLIVVATPGTGVIYCLGPAGTTWDAGASSGRRRWATGAPLPSDPGGSEDDPPNVCRSDADGGCHDDSVLDPRGRRLGAA